jgi:sulfate permease, SulP family
MRRRIQKRYEQAIAALPSLPPLAFRPAAALREVFAEGYGRAKLRADVLAGLVVGIVALPLSMALAIASGVPPQHGLYTAIVGGGAIAILGGSRTQVSGPTAAFVVILSPIAAKYGLGGLACATVMAGLLLIVLGAGRFGSLMQFVPYPVVTGFTSGIAIVIATLQVKDLFGLTIERMPEHYVDRAGALIAAAPTARWQDLAIGATTLLILLWWPRRKSRVPGPLVALTTATLLALVAATFVDGFSVATIGSRFGGIPQAPPVPGWPWDLPGPDGAALVPSFGFFRALANSALAIALLGAIESLLSAVVADGMTGHRHDPDAELVAQGVGNVLAPFFGGFAATGAIARTATNIRSGAHSPVAAIVHAVFVLSAVLVLAPVLSYLPMAALAALLVVVAWNMSEAKHVVHTLRVAPKSDVLVLLTCLGLTVVFDMVVSVTVGVMMAALLFMRRMSDISGAKLVEPHQLAIDPPLGKDVVVYEIAGPLFFGAASKAMSQIASVQRGRVRLVLLDMRAVPVMDATGLVSLESAIARLKKAGVKVVLAGVQQQPADLLRRADLVEEPGRLRIRRSFDEAIAIARGHLPSGAHAAAPGPTA